MHSRSPQQAHSIVIQFASFQFFPTEGKPHQVVKSSILVYWNQHSVVVTGTRGTCEMTSPGKFVGIETWHQAHLDGHSHTTYLQYPPLHHDKSPQKHANPIIVLLGLYHFLIHSQLCVQSSRKLCCAC